MADHSSSMEGLPAGWIVDVRVRKNGKKDKYYIDPVLGYVFRSMIDVSCYLENGKLGRRVHKLKDKDCINVDLGDDKLSSSAEAEGQKLADSGTISRKNEEILQSNCTGDRRPLRKHSSDQCREGTEITSLDAREANDIDHKQGKDDTSKSLFIPASVVGTLPEKRLLENRAEKQESRKIQREMRKLDDKKGSDLPRRASKRLAGVEVPLLELKTTNRVRQVAARQSDEAKVDITVDLGNLANSEEHAEKVETENVTDEKRECPSVEAHAGEEVETYKKDDDKPESPLDLSLKDSWMNMDPCIEFAIKTLTGAIPIGDENNENQGSSLHLPFGDSLTDPCIEFAVKTLTGDIPVGNDLCTWAYFQQKSRSSTVQPCNGLTMPRASLDNLYQANPDSAERPPRPTIF